MRRPSGRIGRGTGLNDWCKALAWLVLVGLCAGVQAADAGRLFRYRDANGVMHIGTSLPPGQAQAGYEILDSRTLKRLDLVAPKPTAEQLAAQARQRRREAADAEREAREQRVDVARQNRDRMLLQTYDSELDILRLRDSKLENLDLIGRGIDNTVGHLRHNLAQLEATIAEHRAAGRPPPASVLESQARTEHDLTEQLEFAARIRAEHAQTAERFAADLDRYRLLTGSLRTTANP